MGNYMEQQNSVSGNDLTPKAKIGRHSLSIKFDIPVLQLIRDSTFITRHQVVDLLPTIAQGTGKRALNARLARLVGLKQIREHDQAFPYSGRVFSIDHGGLLTLELSGLGILSVTSETEILSDEKQVAHFLALNTIQIFMRKFFTVSRWWDDRYLKSLNIVTSRPTNKDYDAVIDVSLAKDQATPIRVGIEYERSLKARDRYANIRKSLASESQIHRLLYFVDNEQIATVVCNEVFTNNLPIGVALTQEFYKQGDQCRVFIKGGTEIGARSMRDFLGAK
jgi:hypothetical protein